MSPLIQSDYAVRARLGLIVPPTNTVNETEWRAMLPAGVSFHTHRMRLHPDVSSEAGLAGLHHMHHMLSVGIGHWMQWAVWAWCGPPYSAAQPEGGLAY